MPKGGFKSPPFVLASIGPSALNNIEGTLLQNTNTFLHGEISDAIIEGGLFQDTDIFNDGTVILGNNVEGSLLENTNTLYHGLTEPINLFGSLLSDIDTLYHGLVGPINLFGSLLSDADTFNAGEVVGLDQTITGSLAGQNINVLDSVTSNSASGGTSHTVNLPDGSNVVGRLVVVCAAADGTPTFTFPAGWTELFDSSDVEVALGIAYREIDGTEGFDGSGDTITITTSIGEPTAHISYLARNANSSNVEVSTAVTGTNTNPDPGSVTPSGGYDNYLNIAIQAHDVGTTTTTGYPSGYVNTQQITVNSSMGCGIGGAYLIAVGSSEDPGTFTISQIRNWVAVTVSIKNNETPIENTFFGGNLGFGTINISGGSVFQEADTFNSGRIYFGVHLSTAQANRSQSTVNCDSWLLNYN
jgi:hypothetical protein